VVALIGAIRRLHLPQQRVHLGNRQATVSMDSRAAGKRSQEAVGGAIKMMRTRIKSEISHDGTHDRTDVLANE
jgi:hypothetical protein